MFGYITTYPTELLVKDQELYHGYYCGVCKSIAHRFGNLPRLTLSYDAAFLAVVLAALDGEGEYTLQAERCLPHPTKQKPVVKGSAVDYAADMLIVLAHFKALDDQRDGKTYKGWLGRFITMESYGDVKSRYPEVCAIVDKQMERLGMLEETGSGYLDMLSSLSGRVMEAVFAGYFEGGLDEETEDPTLRIVRRIGYQMGRWVYLIDALDDIRDDLKNGDYNPLVKSFHYDKEKENWKDFSKRIYDDMENNLMATLKDMAISLDLLKTHRNEAIAENVFFKGLLAQTDRILTKWEEEPAPKADAKDGEAKTIAPSAEEGLVVPPKGSVDEAVNKNKKETDKKVIKV